MCYLGFKSIQLHNPNAGCVGMPGHNSFRVFSLYSSNE